MAFLKNFVICVAVEVLLGVLFPDGKMKKIMMSISGLYLFYFVISPIISVFL